MGVTLKYCFILIEFFWRHHTPAELMRDKLNSYLQLKTWKIPAYVSNATLKPACWIIGNYSFSRLILGNEDFTKWEVEKLPPTYIWPVLIASFFFFFNVYFTRQCLVSVYQKLLGPPKDWPKSYLSNINKFPKQVYNYLRSILSMW